MTIRAVRRSLSPTALARCSNRCLGSDPRQPRNVWGPTPYVCDRLQTVSNYIAQGAINRPARLSRPAERQVSGMVNQPLLANAVAVRTKTRPAIFLWRVDDVGGDRIVVDR